MIYQFISKKRNRKKLLSAVILLLILSFPGLSAFKAFSQDIPGNIRVTADWETFDGPYEWQNSWTKSRHCMRCRQHIQNIEDFKTFQGKIRTLRGNLLGKRV